MSKKKGRKVKYLVGVDVGGSKIMAGVFTHDLKQLHSVKIDTWVHRGPDAVLQRIIDCAKDAITGAGLKLSDVAAIGVGTPGIVNPKAGTVVVAPNLRWENFNLRSRLVKAFRRPVVIGNDCTTAMEGIYEVELRKKPRNALGMFMGTGLGGALVLGGEVYSGMGSIAGEVGHMVVERTGPRCGCGSQGCFEVFSSRTGIANRMRAKLQNGDASMLKELLAQDQKEPGTLRSEHLHDAIKQGDQLAERMVRDAAEYTGLAVASLINLLSPEVVVLGGGLIGALHEQIMPIVHDQVRSHALLRFLKEPKVFATKLGDRAGIVGAAVLARRAATGH
jgi:glucokinase